MRPALGRGLSRPLRHKLRPCRGSCKMYVPAVGEGLAPPADLQNVRPRRGFRAMYVPAVGEGLAPPADLQNVRCCRGFRATSVPHCHPERSEGSFPRNCTDKKILRLREAMTGRGSGGTDCHSHCTDKKILRLREAMTGRGSGGTDCHSQCAHWLRNDVQELSMAKPTYLLQNQQFKHSTTQPLDIRKPPHVPPNFPLARHCEPSRRMVWQSASPSGPVRFCTTPGGASPAPTTTIPYPLSPHPRIP